MQRTKIVRDYQGGTREERHKPHQIQLPGEVDDRRVHQRLKFERGLHFISCAADGRIHAGG